MAQEKKKISCSPYLILDHSVDTGVACSKFEEDVKMQSHLKTKEMFTVYVQICRTHVHTFEQLTSTSNYDPPRPISYRSGAFGHQVLM